MLSTRLVRQFRLPISRQFTFTSTLRENKPSTDTQAPKSQEAKDWDVIGGPMHNVTNFDRRVLVWVKRYPSMDAVPKQVSMDCMMKANTKGRIKACNYMIVLAIIGFLTAALTGKREAAGGRHIVSDRMKWYNEVKQKAKAEAEAAAVAEAAGKS